MKQKLLFMIVALSMGLHVTAQEPIEFKFDNDLEWVFYGGESNNDRAWFHEFCRFEGTAEKNGKTYHILKFTRFFLDKASDPVPEGYQDMDANGSLYIRTEGGRIYVNQEEYMNLIADGTYWHWVGNKDYIPYPRTSDGELILYDFNMQAGDQFVAVDGYENVYVTEVKSIITKDGLTRRVLVLGNGYEIVEGIGCVNSPGMWLFYLNPGLSPYNDSYLSFYGYHPQGSSTWNALYNGAKGEPTGIPDMAHDRKQVSQGELFDLNGRRLKGFSRKGIYIRDNRKRVMK